MMRPDELDPVPLLVRAFPFLAPRVSSAGKVDWTCPRDATAGGARQPCAVVAQAQGMIAVQADCSMDEALALLEQRAADFRHRVETVAVAVVERRFRFA